MSQTFTYSLADDGTTDSITVTTTGTLSSAMGFGPAYAVTAISGTVEGAVIAGEVGTGNTVQTSGDGGAIFDNAIFVSASSGGTYDGDSGSFAGLDVYGLEFSAGGTEYNLYDVNGQLEIFAVDNAASLHDVTLVSTTAPCFLAGTRILTARGEVAVEALEPGDRVVTFSGAGAPLKPVLWLGKRAFNTKLHPEPETLWPVRIRQNALGEGMPQRDLLVSPDHCLRFESALVPAKLIINGATILQDRRIERGTYYHVELAGHDVLLSEGVPSETYLDTGNRDAFEAGQAFAPLPYALPKTNADTCLPLVLSGPLLAALRERLLARAEAMGFEAVPDPDLRLITAAGEVIWPQAVAGMRYHFTVPAGARLHLASRVFTPSEHRPHSKDTRKLGASVRRLWLDDAELALDDPALGEGWYPVEAAEDWRWRWTTGYAALAPAARSVTVELFGGARYWLHQDGLPALTAAA